MFKLLYIERYMIPHVDSMFLGQLLIVTILEAAVTFKSTFIIVNLIDYSDISSGYLQSRVAVVMLRHFSF